jgi:arylsulfatase
MGFSDVGCYGSEIETPHLDELAAGGLRFTQFYNTARCCPTRASLLTGLYPHQTGIGHMVDSRKGGPGYQNDLNEHSVTIAEVLREAGYRNYAVGKWHITPIHRDDSPPPQHNWPLQRGFDRYYGTIHGAGSFWDPSSLVRDNRIITAFNDDEYQPDEPYYYTDAISDHAAGFVRRHHFETGDQPFFLYVAFTAAHWPLHARERDIAKYRGRYDAGFEAVRAERWEKMKELGVIDSLWPLSPAPGAWEQVQDQAFEARCMEVYAAMIDSLDQGVGRILQALKDTGAWDNTLIVYLQDNGGCAETMGRDRDATERAAEPTLSVLSADFLQHGSVPDQTRDGYPVRQGYGVMPGPADTYIAYGRNWANVSNTPFREYKHWVHEGGISTPLIAHWPAGIGAAGEWYREPAHLIDLMATATDVSGATYPSERNGANIFPPEGVSLRPAFAGQPLERGNPIFFEHEGNRAVRDGKWKLVAKGPGGAWELYDMEQDRTEMDDRAEDHADRVATLVEQWEAWARRAQVIPWPHEPAY